MQKILLFILLFTSLKTYSQDSTTTKTLENVTVTASFQPSDIRKTARNVSIITAKEIQNAPVKTLEGILQYALNIDVRSRGPIGVQTDISIRGGHYDQTLIMLDGVKMNDPQTGHHSLNLPIPLEMIERIEVLQGGASRVFGAAAFSGVINIISKTNENSSFYLGLQKGEYGLNKLNSGGAFRFKKIKLIAASDKINSNGFTKNTAFNRLSYFLKSELNIIENGNLNITLGSFSNKFGASNFYFPSVYTQFEDVSSFFTAVNWKHSINQKIQYDIKYNVRKHNDLYDFNDYRSDAKKLTLINIHETLTKDLAANIKYNSVLGTSTFGLEWRNEAVLSNRLGETLAMSIVDKKNSYKYFSAPLMFTKAKKRDNSSLFFEQYKKWKNLTISAGTMFNINSQFGNNWLPGIDISYSISEKTNLYGSVSSSLRFPTFTEMYLVGSTVKGDPNLKPEKAFNYEIGVKYFGKFSSITSSIFIKAMHDAIDKVKRPELSVPNMENIGNLNAVGLELNYTLNLKEFLNNENSFFQQLRLNYANIKADKKEIGFQSFYTLNYLSNKASVGLDFKLTKRFNFTTYYTFKQRKGTYQWDSKSAPLAYQPINLLDARLNFNAKYFRLFLDGTNLLNKTYYEFGFVEQPRRWLSAGFAMELK